jgi:hypothetical protein
VRLLTFERSARGPDTPQPLGGLTGAVGVTGLLVGKAPGYAVAGGAVVAGKPPNGTLAGALPGIGSPG